MVWAKETEFRIGNWVIDRFYGPDAHLLQFQTGQAIDEYKGMVWGIPLAPDILEKCGFEFDADIYKEQDVSQFVFFKSKGRERVQYFPNEDIYKYMICDYGIDKKVGTTIKTVHELQNLFFALTGTELIFNR